MSVPLLPSRLPPPPARPKKCAIQKEAIQKDYRHVKQRLKQRYFLKISRHDYRRMHQQIERGHSFHLNADTPDSDVELHYLLLEGMVVLAMVCRRRCRIVTVLKKTKNRRMVLRRKQRKQRQTPRRPCPSIWGRKPHSKGGRPRRAPKPLDMENNPL